MVDDRVHVTYGPEQAMIPYDDFLGTLDRVWAQCARVLRPGGKLAINAAMMPVPQAIIRAEVRHLKNIPSDIDVHVRGLTGLALHDVFVWHKQTSKAMLGSYPYPGNALANNTLEFIYVYRKLGKRRPLPEAVRKANSVSIELWRDLTQQAWWMMPADVKRAHGHPAPFPEMLPGRLIQLYTMRACEGFAGDVVLDPFCGTGTTCAVANSMGRRWGGIDVEPAYIRAANVRIGAADYPPMLEIGTHWRPRDKLAEAAKSSADPVDKHQRRTFGRSVESGAGGLSE
jgi:modification methylase